MAPEMTSANALVLGDPVKLDERCSPEARSPDLRIFKHLSLACRPPFVPRARRCETVGQAGFEFFLLPSSIHTRPSAGTLTP
jgi:hypothetical protein